MISNDYIVLYTMPLFSASCSSRPIFNESVLAGWVQPSGSSTIVTGSEKRDLNSHFPGFFDF